VFYFHLLKFKLDIIAAAAIPIGSFPATMPSFFALFSILIAFRFVFSPSPAILAILDTP